MNLFCIFYPPYPATGATVAAERTQTRWTDNRKNHFSNFVCRIYGEVNHWMKMTLCGLYRTENESTVPAVVVDDYAVAVVAVVVDVVDAVAAYGVGLTV